MRVQPRCQRISRDSKQDDNCHPYVSSSSFDPRHHRALRVAVSRFQADFSRDTEEKLCPRMARCFLGRGAPGLDLVLGVVIDLIQFENLLVGRNEHHSAFIDLKNSNFPQTALHFFPHYASSLGSLCVTVRPRLCRFCRRIRR